MIRALDEGLVMHQLHFQAEVRSMKDLAIEPAQVSDAEMKLATQLIDQLAVKKFDPGEYKDEFKGRVQAAIKRKVQGKEVSFADEPAEHAGKNVIDLMQALKASLGAKSTDPAAHRSPKRAAASSSSRKAARR